MDIQFKETGGRLFRIALIFSIVCIVAIGVMTYFTATAMRDAKEIALTKVGKDEQLPDMKNFYIQLIDNLKIGTVIGSLSGVLIAIAARYGLRETAQNIASGMSSKTTVIHKGPDGETTTSEEVVQK